MFSGDQLKRFEEGLPKSKAEVAASLIAGLPVEELLRRRAEIDAALPATTLASMDMEKELILQYMTTKTMLHSITTSDDVPMNQKAQIANTCAATLQQLAKLQIEVYTTERHKLIERTLIKALKSLPIEQQMSFLDLYAALHVPIGE